EEHLPVALADAHAPVGERHVAAAIVHPPARARAEEVDQELLLARDAVVPAVRPEAAELRIGPEPGQQIVRHRTDRVVASQAAVEGLLLFTHGPSSWFAGACGRRGTSGLSSGSGSPQSRATLPGCPPTLGNGTTRG